MKRLLSIATIGALAVTALVLVQCDSLTGGAPTALTLSAATDSTVTVSWTAPSEGTPDNYIVMFKETGASSYVAADTVTATTATHNPMGKTGSYKVVAMFGSTEYEAATTPSTTPIANAATAVSELNAAGNSGYGWDRSSGAAATYSMTVGSNAANVDLYITDFLAGFAGSVYSVASPDVTSDDVGAQGVVPPASWRINGFTNPLSSETAPLPAHSNIAYFNYQDITTQPFLTGCYTADGYYALVKVSTYNVGSGDAQVLSWIQIVKGLRLIQH